jgi:hypothetical protein
LVLLTSYVVVNLVLLPQKIVLDPDVPVDWQLIRQLPTAVQDGNVYLIESAGVHFLWSPVMAWLMAGVAMLGYWPWVALHVGAALLLRPIWLAALLLVSYGFWFDTAEGNIVVFMVVAAVLALQGNGAGRIAFLALMILAPRPIGLPLAAWILWVDARVRWPAGALFALHTFLVLLSGDLVTWLGALWTAGLAPGITIGPTAWFGRWWLVVGVPLGVWLARKGYFGWAGLAFAPYVTPQYVIWPLIDLVPNDRRRRRTGLGLTHLESGGEQLHRGARPALRRNDGG